MGIITKEEINLIKLFLNKNKDLDNNLRKKLFKRFYPSLEYYKYKDSNIWESIIYLEFQYLINDSLNKIQYKSNKKNSISKGLWGNSDLGPVG